MPKRKKYPKLPNGYGSIKYLGKGRRNPYAVHPPTKEFDRNGVPITPKALCYTDDWMKGFAILTAFKSETYYPGMEKDLPDNTSPSGDLAQKILADYNRVKAVPEEKKPTFSDVYEQFFSYKYERDKSRTHSKSSINSTKAAYRNAKELHDRVFEDLRHKDLQEVVDNCSLKHSSIELIVTLFHQIYAYAVSYEIVDRDYSQNVKINIADDDEHGEAFTDEEMRILWEHKEDPVVEFMLIMCYSGFRIAAYKKMEVNLDEKYFKGGVKTAAGKNRIVPIHSGIYDMVARRMCQDGCILVESVGVFRSQMYKTLEAVGIKRHTPHDCRHTFSSLCEKYKMNDSDRKRLLGHSFGNDITNGVYGHRSLEDLRMEIEKIKICY